jgi:hypothetical protein
MSSTRHAEHLRESLTGAGASPFLIIPHHVERDTGKNVKTSLIRKKPFSGKTVLGWTSLLTL